MVKPLQLYNRFGLHKFEVGAVIEVGNTVTKECPVDAYIAGALLKMQPDKVRIEDGPKVVD